MKLILRRNFHTSQVLTDCEHLQFWQSCSTTPMSSGCGAGYLFRDLWLPDLAYHNRRVRSEPVYTSRFLRAPRAPYYSSPISHGRDDNSSRLVRAHAAGLQAARTKRGGNGSLRVEYLFWRQQQGGYFNPASAEQPLLHTWSLRIEEQFYILFPILIWFVLRYLAPHRLFHYDFDSLFCIISAGLGRCFRKAGGHILSATDASVGAIRRFAFIDCKAAVSTFTRRAQCAVTYRDCPANRPNLALSTIHRVSRSRRLAASARGYLNNLVGTKRPSITGVIADACAVYWPSIILLLFVALSCFGVCRLYVRAT